MLVLSRNIGEEIIIGDNIVIKVISIRGNVARLGVDAPKSVPVHRKEIWKTIQETGHSTHAGMPSVPAPNGAGDK
jgi:carbon storage regulator